MDDFLPPAFLFHGTSTTRMVAICREGLVPQACDHDVKNHRSEVPRLGVYLTDSSLIAGDFSGLAADRYGGDGVILAFKFTALDMSLLEPDDYDLQNSIEDITHPTSKADCGAVSGAPLDQRFAGFNSWRDVSWQTSLKLSRQALYAGAIPLAHLMEVVYGPGGMPTIVDLDPSKWADDLGGYPSPV